MAEAADRVALVISMSRYTTINPLRNTPADAALIARTLEGLGFETETLNDATLPQVKAAMKDFAFRAETASIALVYYAGHGVEVGGQNYIVPVDVAVENTGQLPQQAVSLKDVLATVENARQLRIVILDSCRNNPFPEPASSAVEVAAVAGTPEVNTAARSVVPARPEGAAPALASADTAALPEATRGLKRGGLAPASPERGMMVVYAAKDGEVALDGSGDNSPFATALADNLRKPDVEIGLMFRQVRDEVMALTGNRQQPHFYGSLTGVPFFLAGHQAGTNPAPADKPTAWQTLAPDQEVQLAALAGDGDTRAMIGLGYIALTPDPGKFDPKKALDFFTTAAGKGDAEAMYELGKLYEKGIGTKQDVAKALDLYRQSAEHGFADAINDLGFLTYQGTQGLERDPDKAIALFTRAAELRHPQAMFNVAALIDDGIVPGKTPEDAARFLYLALRSGVEDVLNQLTTKPTMFKPQTRKALQRLLAENRFYEGAFDGAFGKGTQRSLRLAFGKDG